MLLLRQAAGTALLYCPDYTLLHTRTRRSNPCTTSAAAPAHPLGTRGKPTAHRQKQGGQQRGLAVVTAAVTLHAPASAATDGGLSQAQIDKFHDDGFLVLPGFATQQECTALRDRVAQLVAEHFDPAATSNALFSTRNQTTTTTQYFLDSASNISFFLEEKALDAAGQLRQAKELSLNKMGHALNDLDPVFRAFSRSPKVQSLVRCLRYRRPLPVQSMYIFKQPSIGGEVVPHQDSTFLHTTPLTCLGLWWALEDATQENGCLWAQPGVHKQGLLRRFSVQNGAVAFDRPPPAYDLAKFVPLECQAGSLVLLHGENIHYSCENTSNVSRHSYSMHVVESAPGVEWSADNWAHRRPDRPWEPLY